MELDREATPPPSDNPPVSEGTPHSISGTSSPRLPPKLNVMDVGPLILDDLKSSTMTCDFRTMLSVFLGNSYEGLQSPNDLLETCLKKVLDLQKTQRFLEIKHHLQEYADTRSETARYKPFVKGFNIALDLLAEIEISGLAPADKEDPIVFQRNDPKVLIGRHDTETSQRKPDIVLAEYSTLLALHNLDEDKCSIAQLKSKYASIPPEKAFHHWEAIDGCLELKFTAAKLQGPPDIYEEHFRSVPTDPQAIPSDPYEEDDPEITEAQQSSESSQRRTPQSDRAAISFDRRPNTSDSGRSSAKARRQHLADDAPSRSSSSGLMDQKQPRFKPIVQCALYGAEMLSKNASTTHAINFLITNDIVHIWYLDHRGFIQSSGISFIQDLPWFLVLLLALQRFKRRHWGACEELEPRNGKVSLNIPGTDKTFLFKERDYIFKRYGAVGRSTKVLNAELLGSKDSYVVKISYPESGRVPEPEIIRRARERAGDKTYILDHLPECLGCLDFPQYATSTIRESLGLQHDSNADRILRVTFWKYLDPLPSLSGASDSLWKGYWECYRCHLHLYKLDIHHGDISDTNLMYNPKSRKGILNDFDLATDARDPTHTVGHRRTGTVPFMSIKLFTGKSTWRLVNPNIQRLYLHDEESFRWVLHWVLNCYKGGKLRIPHNLLGWTDLATSVANRLAFANQAEQMLREQAAEENDLNGHSILMHISATQMLIQISQRELGVQNFDDLKLGRGQSLDQGSATEHSYNPSPEDLLKKITQTIPAPIPIDMYVDL